MPILATLMASLFGAAFSFFGRYFLLEKAARLAAWTVAFALMTVVIASMASCINGICATSIANISVKSEYIAMGLGIAWNQITISAAGCYMTVWIVCQLYVIKKKAINMVIGGN